VIAVLLSVLLTVILLTVCLALVWPRPGRTRDDPGRGARDDRFPSGVKPLRDYWPENREGGLARQVSAGEIDRFQYVQAMSRLAERDAARHPLEMPGD
jgi:hypothetical protein